MGRKRCEGCLIDYIRGKWKAELLFSLKGGALRMSELKRRIPEANPRVLARQLRSLEKDGIVQRKVYAEVPLRVEYSLTEYGNTLMELFKMINDFTIEHMDVLKSNPRMPEPFTMKVE